MAKYFTCSLVLLLLFSNCAIIETQAQENNTNSKVELKWEDLTVREKIGQTVVELIDFEKSYSKNNETLESTLTKYPIGAVFMANWLIKGGADSAEIVIKRKIIEYSKNSKIPMLFQEDYETGLGENVSGFTKLPNLMALGATNNKQLAWEYGNTISSEARQMGINWLLHPVCDLNINFLNPLVSTRCLSDDPQKTIQLVSQQIKAMQNNKVAATIKHFPGDGVDFRDQHQVTTVNSLSKKEWSQTFGKVFQDLIDSGANCVMAGHISLPAFQTKQVNGTYLPATLSNELITGLLKGKMRFKGVVISDALNMGGIEGYYASPIETQIESFKAGCDMMLWPAPGYIDTLEARILNGAIPMERLNDAVKRIWELKKKCCLFDSNYKTFSVATPNSKANGTKTATDIAEKSITLVRDLNNQIPLNSAKTKKILWVIVGTKSKTEELINRFQPTKTELEKLGFSVEMRVNCPYYGSDLEALNRNDKIIFAFDHHPHNPMGTTLIYEEEILTVWLAQKMPKDKVISISYGDPYCHNVYLPLINTCINAYSESEASQLAVVKTISGSSKFTGVSPVKLSIPNIAVKK